MTLIVTSSVMSWASTQPKLPKDTSRDIREDNSEDEELNNMSIEERERL